MKRVKVPQPTEDVERRLSPWRVMLGVLLLGIAVVGGTYGVNTWRASASAVSTQPWFASYVDVTSTPSFAFENMGSSTTRDAILSFIVSSSADPCTPAWGGAYTLDQASGSLDLDRRIARLKQQGGSIAISFGGQKNQELAVGCTDQTKLEQAYQSVIDRYDVNTIDLDLENQGLGQQASDVRAKAIAHLQAQRTAEGKPLAVWLTLPVTPQGLDETGTQAVSTMLAQHVDLAGINVMTMDYGTGLAKGQSMGSAAQTALTQTHRQLGILYQRAGIYLNDATLWSKLGATPMIGQNDDNDEVFSLDDAKSLNSFAVSKHIDRMSMWSANRDKTCGSNYIDTSVVSDSCSGIDQDGASFAALLSDGFKGNLALSAGLKTTPDKKAADATKPDDPKTSPYQIWSASGAYLEGTKVVWHHNVYQAKWWTQGDMPDNPVLQSWQTPWELIGPVLPGEKPIQQPTLPAGTYPDWSGTDTYDTGTRVLFDGTPYQAKWWNQGQSPAAASSNPDSSPWTPLTEAQIQEVQAENGTSQQ